MIKWFRSILILALIFIFSAVFTSAQFEGGELTDGEEVEVDVDGDDQIVFTYVAEDDVVITVIVNSEEDLDLVMAILDEDGDEVARDDDSGQGLTPSFIRLALEAGEYTIEIEQYSGEDIEDEIEVTLFEVALLNLNEGPQTVELGDDFEIDRMVFEAEEDEVYAIIITAEDTPDSTLYVDVLEEGMTFANTRMSFRGMDQAGLLFEASDDGIVTIELEFFGFGDAVEFTVEVEQQ
ncbi:MAG: hypothetical protein WBC91_25955 [Phototrophicaceae bacterium]